MPSSSCPATRLRSLGELRRVAGADNFSPFSRRAFAPELWSRHAKKALPRTSLKRREAERRQAHHGFRPAAERKPASVCGARYFRPLPRIGAGLRQRRRARLSAPHRGHAPRGLTPELGSGPRFLESPDPNGRTLSGTSAASTWQSGHAPDGRCPEPPGYAVYRRISGNRPRSVSGVPSRRRPSSSGILNSLQCN